MGEVSKHTRGEGIGGRLDQGQRADDEAVFPKLKLGEAWSESITKGRAAELERVLQAWEQEAKHGERKGPFDGEELNGAEVFWLAARTLAGTSAQHATAVAMDMLRRASNETGARKRLNLSALHLTGAHLRGADLSGALLTGADLSGADLSDANLRRGDLSHADLIGANLTRAKLGGANLVGAMLSYSRVDSAGVLGEVIVDSGVDLSDVFWNDNPEPRDPTGGTKEEQAVAYRDAARSHRLANRALRDQGLMRLASEYRLREQRMERQALWKERKVGGWLFSWFLNLVSGYGERLGRILAAYGVVLLAFTILYWLMGVHSFRGESSLQALWDSFLVSLSAIHGRTTFEQLGAWSLAAWTAAIESVVGIVIEGVFVAMLVQRFFAR